MLRTKFSQTFKICLALMLSVLSSGILQTAPAFATDNGRVDTPAPAKVFVCKYVGTPGVDEVLQEANNPISVSVSSIQQNQWDGTVPGWFSDAHDRSYVLGYDTRTGGGQEGEPSINECPAPQGPVVTVVAPIFTPPTCDAPGTLIGIDTAQYTFARTGLDSAAVLTATAVGNVTLTGTTVFGPYDLTQLTGEECEGDTIPVTPVITPSHQTSVCTEGTEVFTTGSITVTAVAGLHYWLDGSEITGTVSLDPGTYEISFTTDAGFELAAGVTSPASVTINAAAALDCPQDSEEVTLCHATGSETKPFVRITVSAAGAFNGHLDDDFGGNTDHQNGEDIIPTFTYNGETYSQNWTEGDVLPENCAEAEAVTPVAAQFLNPTCENPTGRVVITATTGVTYKVGDTVLSAGTTTYPAGTSVTVTAHADEGYFFAEGTATTWMHTFTAAPTNCVLGDNDVCPNIEGTQSVVPAGFIQNPITGDCFTPGRGAATPPQTLGTSLPETLPVTGSMDNPFLIIIASLVAYGATYFLQGRRRIAQNLNLSA
jgi:hypothetical protein